MELPAAAMGSQLRSREYTINQALR